MAPEDFSPDCILPGTRIGAYVVRTMLGQGGSSSVYEVESAEGRRFALIICRYHGGASRASERRVDQRCSRSIISLQLLKGLRNVAELYAYGRYPDPLHGYQYLVQELVPGGLLITDWVKRESPTLRKLIGAFVELAELCSVMASKGICHRDLKAANILVTPDGTPKVIDFENATCPHVEPVTLREASEVPGTGGWQCPEVCPAILEEESRKKGKKASGFHPWGDLLSLGVVFSECLTGDPLSDTPIHLERLSALVPRGLAKVVMKLLEKRPEARYRDGAEVAKDLRKLLKKVKDRRWDRPFKQPVSDEEDAPALPFASPPVPPDAPPPDASAPEPDTPSSEPHVDTPRVLDFGEAGTYTLEQCLGRGGMGEVYRARQVGAAGFVQRVAIKRLYPGARPSEARSFVDEARVLSRLHHENIARVYAFHEWKGSYYLVMEYIEGHSLHALLELARRKGHRFSEPVACAIMADVADALHHAHHATDEAGRPLHLVHRDVSPTNILITKEGRVVLVDFGVAFFQHDERIATPIGSTIKGKAPYLSPEQVKHRSVDGRSDLFSVGTILMELLTGEAPFGWTADELTLRRIAGVTPEYVALHLPGVSEPLRTLCQKLLAPHPDQRFATGREVAMPLRQHAGLGGESRQSIQAEVERLQARPDASTPPVPAVEVAARPHSGGKRARRVLAFAAALMLATLVVVSWYVLRYAAVPGPSSPSLQGPTVASARPPERTIAPAPQAPPSSGMPKREQGAAVTSGPSSPEYSAPAPVLADKKARIPLIVTSLPAGERRTDGAAGVSFDSDEATGTLRGKLVTAEAQLAAMTASYVRLSAEATSPDHALALLLAQGKTELTAFVEIHIRTYIKAPPGVDLRAILLKRRYRKAVLDKTAIVIQVTNRDTATSWNLDEVRLMSVSTGDFKDFAVAVSSPSISPGASGRIALVMDADAFASGAGERLVLELWRLGGLQAKVDLVAASGELELAP